MFPRTALLLAAALAIVSRPATAADPVDAIIARVNGEPILLSQLREAAFEQELPLPTLGAEGLRGDAARQALTYIVDETLLVQQAEREQIKPDETALAREVDALLQSLERRLGGSGELDVFLAARHLTLDELRDLLRQRERRRMLLADLISRRVQLDAGAVETFARGRRERGEPTEMVRVAQILVRTHGGDPESAANRAEWEEAIAIARDVSAQPDRFVELAREKSDDEATRQAGGDLGWIDPRALRPALAETAASLREGETSAPVWGGEGWHILRLLGRRSARDLLYIESFERERTKLVTELREEATIRLYDPAGG